jgi:RNA polymerase sigma-70 factor (ECF subfamily)
MVPGGSTRGHDEGALISQQVQLGGAASAGSTKRTAAPATLCLVPVTIAPELLPTLERFFSDLGGVRVVVDHREGDRRRAAERRRLQAAEVPLERRRIRNAAGRRVGERRAPLLLEAAPPLPREAGEHAQRLRFVRRDEREDRLIDLRASWALVRFQGGERDAFDALYRDFYARLGAYVTRMLGDPHEADDVVQDVFAALVRHADGFDPQRGSARAWIFAVAHNQSLNRLRKLRRVSVDDFTGDDAYDAGLAQEPAPELASDRLEHERVIDLLYSLPRSQKQVLWLRYVADLSTAEIAKALSRTPESVRKLQSRGLATLSELSLV